MAGKQPGTVESLLECPICLGDFTDPRILPCLHTLCRGCLESHVTASRQGDKFSCPSCRHECLVPEGGLSAIPKNFFLNSFRELLEYRHKNTSEDDSVFSKSTEDSEQRQCHNTKRGKTPHGQVTVFCVDCRRFYCKSCESTHHLFAFGSSHQFQSISEVDATTVVVTQQEARIPTCDQHPVLQLDMYCDTCNVPVCAKCCVLTHKQHEYRELAVVGQEFQDKLSKLTKAAGAHINKLDQHVEGLQTSHCDIQRDTDKACQEVDQAADEMIDLVNKRRQHLKQQLRDAEERALVEVKAACKDTELNKATTQSLLSYMQALQESGNITDQIVHTPGLQEQLHQQETVPLHAVTWTACLERETNSVAALDAMLGTVNVDHSDVTSPAAADVDQMKLGQPLKKFKCGFGGGVAAIAILDDCVCAAKWEGSELYVHNIVTTASKQHTLSGFSSSRYDSNTRQHTCHYIQKQNTPLCYSQPTQHGHHYTQCQKHRIWSTTHQHPPSHWSTCHCRWYQ